MLTNFDIERICKKLNLPIVGVFSKDELPSSRKIGSYYINMQSARDGDGTHWVLAKIYDDDNRDESKEKDVHKVGAIFFDPFGLDMPREVERFLSPFKPISYNNRQIQDVATTECGWYCISCDYALEHKQNDETYLEDFEKYLEVWSDRPKKNLAILKSMFKPL